VAGRFRVSYEKLRNKHEHRVEEKGGGEKKGSVVSGRAWAKKVMGKRRNKTLYRDTGEEGGKGFSLESRVGAGNYVAGNPDTSRKRVILFDRVADVTGLNSSSQRG